LYLFSIAGKGAVSAWTGQERKPQRTLLPALELEGNRVRRQVASDRVCVVRGSGIRRARRDLNSETRRAAWVPPATGLLSEGECRMARRMTASTFVSALAFAVFAWSAAYAWHAQGLVVCDSNANGLVDNPGDLPLDNVL